MRWSRKREDGPLRFKFLPVVAVVRFADWSPSGYHSRDVNSSIGIFRRITGDEFFIKPLTTNYHGTRALVSHFKSVQS